MQHARWERIRELFESAISLPGAEQREFLECACGEDSELRLQVERMLAADEASGHSSGNETDVPETGVFPPGEVLASRFVIRRKIGAGGMGEVYEADDLRLGERVAVKTVRNEFLADHRFRERFRREIQLARTVNHRNLCRIHDLLDDTGHPNQIAFTMELLEGETLAKYLERNGRLDPEAALPLIRQMCEGLTALHEEAIVHRDLKPGNVILSNGSGHGATVKITDFGLARRIVDADSTRSGVTGSRDVVGTPRYMSPEQLTGRQVTAATDIYAVGVVIYEMVTGRLPFEAEGVGENAIQKSSTVPEPPSRHVPGLHGNWDEVVLRCLDADPERRPRHAMEIVHALNGEPLPRLAPGLQSRPWLAGLRSRRWLALGMAAVLIAVGGWLTADHPTVRNLGFWGAGNPPGLAATAELQRVAVLPFRTMGGDAETQALAGGLMDVVTKGISQYEGINSQLSVVPASEVRSRKVENPAAAFKLLGANRSVEGTLQVEGKRVHLMLTLVDGKDLRQVETSVVEGAFGQLTDLRKVAVVSLSTMLGLRVQPTQVHSGNEPAPGAEAWYLQGVNYVSHSYTRAHLEHAMGLYERALQADPQYALAYAGLADAQWRMYEQYRDPQWVEKALGNAQRSLRLNRGIAEAHTALGAIYRGTGRYPESLASFQEALRLEPRNADAFKGMADTYTAMGDRDADAVATYRKALELRPSDWQFYLWLGNFYLKRKDYGAAIRQFENVATMVPDNPKGYVNIGAALLHQEKYPEAIPWLEKAVSLEPTSAGFNNLGICYTEQGDFAKAARFFEQAADLNPNDYKVAASLAWAYGWLKDPREAEVYKNAARLAEAELRLNPKREELYSTLAMSYAGAGNRQQADRWLQRAAQRKNPTAEEMARNAGTLAKLKRQEEAFAWLKRAVENGRREKDLRHSLWLQPLLNSPRYRALARLG